MADVTGRAARCFASRLLDRSWLSKDTFQIELERPHGFTFEPGQGIRFIRDGLEREYSLICAQDSVILSVCVRRVENGRFSPWLAGLDIGTSLAFSGPHGFFVFRPSRRPVCLSPQAQGLRLLFPWPGPASWAFCSSTARRLSVISITDPS